MNKLLKPITLSLLIVSLLCSCSSQTSTDSRIGAASTSVPAATVNDDSTTKTASKNEDKPDTSATNNTTSNNPATNKEVIKLTDTVVSKSQYDINNDGKKEGIEIVLTDGVFDEDRELWAGNGPKWIGNFLIRVVSEQKVLSSQSLNELMGANYGETLFFWAPEFSLKLRDYNSDNKIDFNLGQYFSSNGCFYMLFTVDSQGSISKMPFENDVPFLFIADHTNSTDKIVSDGKSIKFRYYDNVHGEYHETTYKWDVVRKLFILFKNEIIKL